MGFGTGQTGARKLALLLTNSVTSTSCCRYPKPQFPHLPLGLRMFISWGCCTDERSFDVPHVGTTPVIRQDWVRSGLCLRTWVRVFLQTGVCLGLGSGALGQWCS